MTFKLSAGVDQRSLDWVNGKTLGTIEEAPEVIIPVDDRLLLHYKFDEVGTDIIKDYSNYGRDGLATGGYEQAQPTMSSKSTGGIKFDGISGMVSAPADPELILLGDITISIIFMKHSHGETNQRIFMCGGLDGDFDGSNNYAFDLTVDVDQKLRYFHEYDSGSNQTVTTDLVIQNDIRYHLLVTRDTATKTVRIYMNAQLIHEYSYSFNPTNASNAVIATGNSPTLNAPSNITVQEMKVWNFPMTPEEANDDYLLNHIYSVEDYRGWYDFEEGSGQTAHHQGEFSEGVNITLSSDTMWGSDSVGGHILTDAVNYGVIQRHSNLYDIRDGQIFTFGTLIDVGGGGIFQQLLSLCYQSSSSDSGNVGIRFVITVDNEVGFRIKTLEADGFNGGSRGVWNTGVFLKTNEPNLVIVSRNFAEASVHVYNSDGYFTATYQYPFESIYENENFTSRKNMICCVNDGNDEPAYISHAGAKIYQLFIFNRILLEEERNVIFNGGNKYYQAYPYETQYGVNMSFQALEPIGWSVNTGTPRYLTGWGGGQEGRYPSNTTAYMMGGSSDESTRLTQFISIPTGATHVDYTYCVGNSFTDTDAGFAVLNFFADGGSTFIGYGAGEGGLRDSGNVVQQWIRPEPHRAITPIIDGADTVKIYAYAERGATGTSNNGIVDELKVDFYEYTTINKSPELLINAGFGTGSMIGWDRISGNALTPTTNTGFAKTGTYGVDGGTQSSVKYGQTVDVSAYNTYSHIYVGGISIATHKADNAVMRFVAYDVNDNVITSQYITGAVSGGNDTSCRGVVAIETDQYPNIDHIYVEFELRRQSGTDNNCGLDSMTVYAEDMELVQRIN